MAGLVWRTALVVVAVQLLASADPTAAVTNPTDTLAIQAFYKTLQDPDGNLDSWKGGNNPCENAFRGVVCTAPQGPSNSTFVQELRLFDLNLGGTLAPELGNLVQLVSL